MGFSLSAWKVGTGTLENLKDWGLGEINSFYVCTTYVRGLGLAHANIFCLYILDFT